MRQVLIVEDSPTDAELIERNLHDSGMDLACAVVSTKDAFLAAIKNPDTRPDIILADYTIPSFSGMDALSLAHKYASGTPFIFVTGTMGEETAVEALKSGAADYVLKDRLFRLPYVVARALSDAEKRKQLKRTEERKEEIAQELMAANRMKDDFLALLSHELRNPLMPLLVNADLVASEAADPTARERADVIRRQAYHMSKLLDDLLDVTRITQGKITLKKQVVGMQEIVRDAIEMVRPLAQERQHAIVADVAPLRLYADPVRLEQIIVNLLNNAIKYTDRGGRIRIYVHEKGGSAIIAVQDTGIGMPADLIPHVFDLFVRGNHSVGRTQGGLGIGLTLVKRLAELHGGSVQANSAGLHRGSEFIVTIPTGSTDTAYTPAPTAKHEPARAHKDILVVDDNHDLANALGTALRTFGHGVRIAYDGAEALRIAGEMRPDVVLLDIGLPVMDGLAVARQLRERFGGSVELIAISGYGQEQDKQDAFKAGFDRYIVKPIGLRELKELL